MPASEIVFAKSLPAYVMMDHEGRITIQIDLPNFEVNVKWQLNNTTAAEVSRRHPDPIVRGELPDEEVPF